MTQPQTLQKIQKSLLNISLALEAIENGLPILFDSYRLALKNKLITLPPSDARIQLLEIILPEIRKEIEGLNALVLGLVGKGAND